VPSVEDDPGELPDVHEHVPAAGDVAVDDVDPGAVVELRVLEAVGRVQLAVGAGRVVEQLGQRPHDMVVVVEDLVVVSGRPTVPSFATTRRRWSCVQASRSPASSPHAPRWHSMRPAA
jgi:hypothetical protein